MRKKLWLVGHEELYLFLKIGAVSAIFSFFVSFCMPDSGHLWNVNIHG